MVSDFIVHNTWSDALLADSFGLALCSRTKDIYLPLNACDDSWVWIKDTHSIFNASSVYNSICCTALPSPDPGWHTWNKIWKINILPKVHFFFWKFSHSRLPTLDVIQTFNPFTNVDCPFVVRIGKPILIYFLTIQLPVNHGPSFNLNWD